MNQNELKAKEKLEEEGWTTGLTPHYFDKMPKKKKVEKYEEGEKVSESFEECHPLEMKPASKFIKDIWYGCIRELFEYKKKPSLYRAHKLFLDDRLEEGLKQYKNKDIEEIVVTESDVRAEVKSRSRDEAHTVILKNWLPDEKPRKRYEIVNYLENLEYSCGCEDFRLNGQYRTNASLCCSHVAAVMWFLMDKKNMPRFLVEKTKRYKKSKPEELETKIEGHPLKKYDLWLNVLLLKEFRGQGPSVSLSLHRRNKNTGKKSRNWITITEREEVQKVIDALERGVERMEPKKGEKEEEGKLPEELKYYDLEGNYKTH